MYKTTSQTTNPFERKRPHPNNSKRNIIIPPPPSFPSFHHNIIRKRSNKEEEASFELSFLIIGAQKAGTTWLHTLLRKCSHIALPHSTKEVHFWDWHYGNGFDWYVRQFVHPRRHHRRQQHSSKRSMGSNAMMTLSKTKLEGGDNKKNDNNINDDVIDVGNDDDELLYGEVTPCYIVLPIATIAEIHECFPNMKLIFIARNLVDRAWSAMVMELRDQSLGMKPGEFANGVLNDDATSEREGEGGSGAKKTKNECNSTSSSSMAQQWRIQQQSSPMAQTDTYFLERLCSETHTSRSEYAKHLRYWYSIFPPESILLLNYDEISIDPRNVLRKVVSHIGLTTNDANAFVASLSDEDVRQRVNAAAATSADQMMNTNSRSDDPSEIISTTNTLSMRPTLKLKMQTYLLPFTNDFNALLVEQGYTWKI